MHPKFSNVINNSYFDLLKYLIRNGYIDETYQDYMSYFYENSISAADKKFLRSITDQKAKDYQYKLSNPQHVVKRLNNSDYSRQEILNYDLLDYLLGTCDVTHAYIVNFIKRLSENCALDFVFGYLDRGNHFKPFIKAMCSYWPGVFDEVVKAQDYSEEQRRQLALLIVYYADEELSSVNSRLSLTDYIDHNDEFLDIIKPKIERINQAFETLGIQFEDINFQTANEALLQSIYQSNMYVLNEVMIGKILENIYGIERSDQYLHQNLTLIRSHADSALYHYVDHSINTYIEQYLSFCQGTINDNEETIAWIMNHETLSDENKENYLDCLSSKMNHINLLDEIDFKALVLSMNLAVCSMENIADYFFDNENKYDEVLVDFINQNDAPNDIKSALMTYEKEQIWELFTETTKCNELNNGQYSALIEGLDLHYKSFEIEGIQDDKIRLLIDLNVIRMDDKEVLIFMRKRYPEQTNRFIEKNIKSYCETILDKDTFNLEEAIELLSSKIHLNYKMKLLSYTDAPISICNEGYPNKLVLYLLKHNFDKKDLPVILSDYCGYSTDCQSEIRKLLTTHIDTIIKEEYPISFQLLWDAIIDQLTTRDNLMKLFSFSANRYDENQAKECLNQLEQYEYLSLFDGKRPKFPATKTNMHILDAFKKHDWISSYTQEDGEYRAYGRKIEHIDNNGK